MALTRLRNTIQSLVMHYIEDDRESYDTPYIPGAVRASATGSSRWISAVKKVYFHNNALTLFIQDDHLGERAYDVINRISQHNSTHADLRCGSTLTSSAGIDESSIGLIPISGTHAMTYHVAEVSDKDLLSLVVMLKKHEIEADEEITEHMISGAIHKSYPLSECEQVAHIVDSVDKVLKTRCVEGAKSFAQSFIETFCNKYLKPLLINQGMNHDTAAWFMTGIKASTLAGLTGSLSRASLSSIVREGIHSVLNTAAVNGNKVEDIVSKIATVLAVSEDPFNLIELGINGGGAEAGQFAAYQLIYQLPKLKKEPAIKEREVRQEIPAGMRLRYAY